jgi:hypothetical protein
MPVISVLGISVVLGTRYTDDYSRSYYIWLITDIALNILCCLNYLVVVERIEQEQNESKDTYEKVSVLE